MPIPFSTIDQNAHIKTTKMPIHFSTIDQNVHLQLPECTLTFFVPCQVLQVILKSVEQIALSCQVNIWMGSLKKDVHYFWRPLLHTQYAPVNYILGQSAETPNKVNNLVRLLNRTEQLKKLADLNRIKIEQGKRHC